MMYDRLIRVILTRYCLLVADGSDPKESENKTRRESASCQAGARKGFIKITHIAQSNSKKSKINASEN